MAILDNLPFVKFYESKEFLQDELALGKTIRQIASECHVSYKLVNLWAVKHGLITRTPEMKFP